MTTPLHELHILENWLDELESYLISDQVFWPGNDAALPQLTLGVLLLTRQRLQSLVNKPAEQAQLTRFDLHLDSLRQRWRSAWTKKAATEYRARLTLWRNFVDDYRNKPAAHYDRYAYETRVRTMLDLLATQAESLPPEQEQLLKTLDEILKVYFTPGKFIWPLELSEAFPASQYWYLYGALPEEWED